MSFDREHSPYYSFSPHPSLTPIVRGLIIANIVAFGLQLVFGWFLKLDLAEYLGLNPIALLKQGRIWQLVTYGFLHSTDYPLHIIFNLLFLYWFGRDVELTLGRKRFLVFYFTAIIVAGLAFCAVHRALVTYVIGASGGIMAIMVVYAIYWPNRTVLFFFLFPMKVRTLVILMVGLNAYAAVTAAGGNVAHLAHLGGAAYGYLFIKFGPALEALLARSREGSLSREQARRRKEAELLDNILEKVHQQGMHKLKPWEKKFLLRESKKRSTPRGR